MNLITRALSAVGLERRSTANPNDMWGPYQALRNGPVNDQTVQGVSAAYACVQAVSEAVATIPLVVYRRNGLDREAVEDHPLHHAMNMQANPEQSALEAKEFVQASVMLRGNGYARLEFGSNGQLRHWWPWDVDRVRPMRLANGGIAYDYTDRDGSVKRYSHDEVLHIRHRLGPDGVLGISPVEACRASMQLAITEQEHGEDTYRNGAKLLGVLQVPGKLQPNQKQDIKEGWQTNRSGQTPILEHGAEYKPLSMSLADAQWLEARKFSVEEIARIFRVPPSVVGHLVDSNYSTSSELYRQWVSMGLRRPLMSWEQAITAKCLTTLGRKTYTLEMDYENLLRGSSTERAEFYESAIGAGWMDAAEVRRKEYLPPKAEAQNAPV